MLSSVGFCSSASSRISAGLFNMKHLARAVNTCLRMMKCTESECVFVCVYGRWSVFCPPCYYSLFESDRASYIYVTTKECVCVRVCMCFSDEVSHVCWVFIVRELLPVMNVFLLACLIWRSAFISRPRKPSWPFLFVGIKNGPVLKCVFIRACYVLATLCNCVKREAVARNVAATRFARGEAGKSDLRNGRGQEREA